MAEAARKAKVNCVVGINELSDRPGSRTVFNPFQQGWRFAPEYARYHDCQLFH